MLNCSFTFRSQFLMQIARCRSQRNETNNDSLAVTLRGEGNKIESWRWEDIWLVSNWLRAGTVCTRLIRPPHPTLGFCCEKDKLALSSYYLGCKAGEKAWNFFLSTAKRLCRKMYSSAAFLVCIYDTVPHYSTKKCCTTSVMSFRFWTLLTSKLCYGSV